jgi:hypothetical protein
VCTIGIHFDFCGDHAVHYDEITEPDLRCINLLKAHGREDRELYSAANTVPPVII